MRHGGRLGRAVLLALVGTALVSVVACRPAPAAPSSSTVPADVRTQDTASNQATDRAETPLGPDPQMFIGGLSLPESFVVRALSGDAAQQLLVELTEDPRVAPFVVDAAAVAVGRNEAAVGVVLSVRLVPEAAADPDFRTSLAIALAGVAPMTGDRLWMGGAVAVWWVDSTFVVLRAPDDEVREALLAVIAAGTA